MPEMLNLELSLENCFPQIVSSLVMFPHMRVQALYVLGFAA